jgi:hypothetical protein
MSSRDRNVEVKFSPAQLPGTPDDPVRRLNDLKRFLDPNAKDFQPKEQHENIRCAIRLYEDGKLPKPGRTWIHNGKVVAEEKVFGRVPWVWLEESMACQFASKCAYGLAPGGTDFHVV